MKEMLCFNFIEGIQTKVEFSREYSEFFPFLQFGGLEALITGICDEWPQTIGRKREMFVAGLIVYCFFGALATTTYVSI